MNQRIAMSRPPDIDFGGGVQLWYFGWYPDRDLNPQYADLPDVDRAGANIAHGADCMSAVEFHGPVTDKLFKDNALWTVVSWEPLTLTPSILCRLCGWHVFIRDGKVVTC